MDDTKKTGMETIDQKDQPDMTETGGDVRAMDSDAQKPEGVKGGEAQQKQEESFKEYEEKGKSEDKGNQPAETDDLWGEE